MMTNNNIKNITLSDNTVLTISKASIEDASDIVNFLNEVAGETDFLTFGFNDFFITPTEEKKIIKSCLEKNISLMLVGKLDNNIISQLFLQRSDKARLWHFGEINITVSKEHWGKSIGRHMLAAAIEWALNNNISKLQLQVRTDNTRAISLYQKLGFVIEGKITRSIKINSIYFNDYIMGLQL